MIEKNTRISNPDLLEKFRRRKCQLCGKSPVDACHIKTKGSGGDDVEWNLLSMCRNCHNLQHLWGFYKLCEQFPFLRQILAQKGWVFDGNKKLRREDA